MNNKIKLYIDFDSTIVDSIGRVIEMGNNKYGVNEHRSKLSDYNFKSVFPSITKKEIDEMFCSEEFFNDNLKYMPNCYDVLNKYKDLCDIYIVSVSYNDNLKYKSKWIDKNLPFVKQFIPVNNNDKHIIDMRNGIQIDDTYECLRYTNALVKILYKDNNDYQWQHHSNENIYNVNTWREIDDMLSFYLKEGVI